MSRSGAPSLIDVARFAGVSTATAGRALGGYGRVREETRARVQAAAEQLRYRSNGLARSMITGSTQLIGVIVTDVSNPFFASALRGVTDATQEAGFDVLLASTGSDVEAEARAVGVMSEKRVDGVILAAANPAHSSHLLRFRELGVPLVLLDRGIADLTKTDSVMIDHDRAMRDAVEHLLELGHRRIGIVTEAAMPSVNTLPADALLPSQLRLAAYLDAMAEAAVSIEPDWIATAAYDRNEAYRATVAALGSAQRPTALVCTDSVLASGAFRAAQDLGLAMPHQLSIIGFDDDAWTTLVRPELTVVTQPSYELGAQSARQLVGPPPDEGDRVRDIRLLARLIKRGSTAPPDSA